MFMESRRLAAPLAQFAAATTGADVSHDGRRVVAVSTGTKRRRSVDSRTGQRRHDRYDQATRRCIAYETPRWSQDDRWIAFAANEAGNFSDVLYTSRVSWWHCREVAAASDINGIAWLPDGSGIVYASSSGSTIDDIHRCSTFVSCRERESPNTQLTVGDVSHVHPDVVRLPANSLRAASA